MNTPPANPVTSGGFGGTLGADINTVAGIGGDTVNGNVFEFVVDCEAGTTDTFLQSKYVIFDASGNETSNSTTVTVTDNRPAARRQRRPVQWHGCDRNAGDALGARYRQRYPDLGLSPVPG